VQVARRISAAQWQAVEAGLAAATGQMLSLLPAERAAALAEGPVTIDLDTTDVEVYGRKKRGAAYNHQGQRVGRPHVAAWAETEIVLGDGTDDPRATAPDLLRRALAALPAAARASGRVATRADAGYFAGQLARAALRSITAMDLCPPSAWNGSWDDAQNNPSAASAVSAMIRVICAASALGARAVLLVNGRSHHRPRSRRATTMLGWRCLRVMVRVRCPRSRPRCSMSAPVASDIRSPFRASREISACSSCGSRPAATRRGPSSLRSRATACDS
jgi:hypothetical protein